MLAVSSSSDHHRPYCPLQPLATDDELDDETWGSDFDDDVVESPTDEMHKVGDDQDLYEIPDGKPSSSSSLLSFESGSSRSGFQQQSVPEWLRKVEALHGGPPPPPPQPVTLMTDENIKPTAAVYIENVLLPTRATKDDESKNFIEALKRKLSQRNLLAGNNNSNNNHCSPKPFSGLTKNNNNVRTDVSSSSQSCTLRKTSMERSNSIDMESLRKIQESVQKFPWFYKVDRAKAELILANYDGDGAFLVRECHHGSGPNVPFTLTIRFALRLFHIQIRIRPEDSRFALGSAKPNEVHFDSIQEMIDTYRKTPLQLHTNGKYFGETKLTNPPIVYSLSK